MAHLLDQQIIDWEPDRSTPVGIASECTDGWLGQLVLYTGAHLAIHPLLEGLEHFAPQTSTSFDTTITASMKHI